MKKKLRINSDPIVYHHISSSGGLSFSEFIKACMSKHEIMPKCMYDAEGHIKEDRFRRLFQGDFAPKYKYFTGHNAFSMENVLPFQTFNVTILRNPVLRVLSMYDYSKSMGWVANMTLKEFMSVKPIANASSLYYPSVCRFGTRSDEKYMNHLNSRWRDMTDKERLESGKQFLDTVHFSGIMELFDESVFLLALLRGWDSIPLTTKHPNPNPKRTVLSELPADVVDHIERVLRPDIEFYALCLKKFRTIYDVIDHSVHGLGAAIQAYKEVNNLVPQGVIGREALRFRQMPRLVEFQTA